MMRRAFLRSRCTKSGSIADEALAAPLLLATDPPAPCPPAPALPGAAAAPARRFPTLPDATALLPLLLLLLLAALPMDLPPATSSGL